MGHLLLTGATGFVGGEVLHALTHPKVSGLDITCLIRDSAKARQVQSLYPDVKVAIGDLDDVELVQREAEVADIVLHLASTSHVASAKAIAKGLQNHYNKMRQPGYWIQISGATCFAAEEIASSHFGFASNVVYDDTKDQGLILSVLQNNPKRVVENIVLSQSSHAVKTALIIAPLIYGAGQGPGNQRSVQAPEIVKSTLNLGHAFKLNDGLNIWSNVHVQDFASLVVLLVSKSVDGAKGLWNNDGLYNVENGEMIFRELNRSIANVAYNQGLISGDIDRHIQTVDAARANTMSDHAAVLWGTNARTRASKARQQLDWSPSGSFLVETLPDLVRIEGEKCRKEDPKRHQYNISS